MAYTTITHERANDIAASKNSTGTSYTRSWDCWIVDESDETTPVNAPIDYAVFLALNADDIPVVGTSYPEDAAAVVTNIDVGAVDAHRSVFIITVNYETPKWGAVGFAADPWDEAPSIQWGSTSISVVADKDNSGAAIVNSAGDPFDPPLMDEKIIPELTLTRNVQTFDPDDMDEYKGAVNSSSNTIVGKTCAARTALIADYGATRARANGVSYWVETLRIQINSDTWDRSPQDKGFNYLTGSPQTKKPIKLDGATASEPQFLDGSGGILSLGGTVLYRNYRVKKEKSFTALNLNITP